jgi:hypothetical protein
MITAGATIAVGDAGTAFDMLGDNVTLAVPVYTSPALRSQSATLSAALLWVSYVPRGPTTRTLPTSE